MKMNATQVFIETARRVINSGKTANARDFAEKIRDQILAKGDDWIEKNKFSIHATISNFSVYSSNSGEIAPIEMNRLFYLEKWQLALAQPSLN